MSRRSLALLLGAGSILAAQGPTWIREHYLKQEVRIPMRDGVELFTAIYRPRVAPGPLPLLMTRTGYGIGPYGPDAYPDQLGPSEALARDGYIFVYQDVRGRMMSGGQFLEMTPHLDGRGVDEASDSFDTIQWLLEQVPGHNGKVGAWGISYPGFYAASTLVGAHPALRAVSPQAPIADLFAGDDDHHNGALFLSQAFWFAAGFGKPRPEPVSHWDWDPGVSPGHPDGYRFFLEMGGLGQANQRYLQGRIESWNALMAHPSYDGYWQARNLRPHLGPARPAVLTVGGWFDAEDLFGTLQVHRRLAQAGPDPASLLVMGPWSHGGWSYGPGQRLGEVDFGQATGEFYREQIEAPFFRHLLKAGPDPKFPKAFVFETGSNRWQRFDAWPPKAVQPTPLYLVGEGGLSFSCDPDPAGVDSFVSDPAHPVPYLAGTELTVAPEYMVGDQRFASRRPDVLVYQTPVLEQPLTLAGPIQVHLQVSSTGTDADWVVKVIDVYPDSFRTGPAGPEPAELWEAPCNPMGGYQQLLRGEVLRGKFRTSLSRPEPFQPGQATPVSFTLNDVCHQFPVGHRLMVQVQSSWFPLVDRNPQVFMDIPSAQAQDFRAQEHRLFHSAALPSYLVLPLLK